MGLKERVIEAVKLWTRDQDNRPWGFWLAIMWAVSGGMALLGFLYLVGFSEVAINNPAYAALYHIPGGLRTYGIIQLVLGLGLGFGLTRPTGWSHVRLRYVLTLIVINGAYAAVTALAFFAAPAVPGGERNIAWVLWGIIAAVLMIALPWTPVSHGLPHRRREPAQTGAGDGA